MPQETVADPAAKTHSSPGSKNAPRLLENQPSGDIAQDVRRALPSSDDAEKGLLSSMLQSPQELIGAAIEKIDPDHFYVPAHRTLFELLVELHDANKPIDLITLTQVLMDRSLLSQVGGPAAVTDLYAFVPTAAHFDFYIEIVKAKSTLRRIIQCCTESITRAYEDQEDVPALLDEVERNILAIREGQSSSESFRSMKEEVMDTIEFIERVFQNKESIVGLSTGFKDFDEMTSGLHGGEMIIVAARPSMGKTSLAMNIVEYVGIEHKKPVAVFSLEMSTQQLVQRLLCSRAGIQMQKLRGGFLSKNDFPKIMEVANQLASSPIFIDDTPGLSILELRAKSRRLKKMAGIELIAVDYLQLLRSTTRRGQDNRQIEIAEISAGLKALAKELNIPVLVLAQLNRQPETRGDGKPRLSDLRESGSIEQDADVVGLLVREQYYKDDPDEKEAAGGKAELIIAKQRNGPTGDIRLTFLDDSMRFVDRAEDDEEEF